MPVKAPGIYPLFAMNSATKKKHGQRSMLFLFCPDADRSLEVDGLGRIVRRCIEADEQRRLLTLDVILVWDILRDGNVIAGLQNAVLGRGYDPCTAAEKDQ
ncbi:hypothetical protein D3C72_1804160 [compost metagenome]